MPKIKFIWNKTQIMKKSLQSIREIIWIWVKLFKIFNFKTKIILNNSYKKVYNQIIRVNFYLMLKSSSKSFKKEFKVYKINYNKKLIL